MAQPMPPAMQPMPMPMPIPQPVAHQPSTPAFLPSQTAARVGRPIEPWNAALRAQMFLWGGLLLVAFLVPASIDPLRFNWDAIIDGEGTAKLPPLIVAAVGLLSIVLAAIPTSPTPRALMAAMFGLVGVFVPVFLPGMPPWQTLATLGGMTLLIPGLLMRTEYRDSLLPRVLITLGALAAMAPSLVPVNDKVMLLEAISGIADAPAVELKILLIVPVLFFLILVLTLLAWLPSPSKGLSNVLLWVVLLWPIVPLFLALILAGPDKLGDSVMKETGALLSWIHGLNGITSKAGGKEAAFLTLLFGSAMATGFGVLIAYGTATMVGKKLE
jgi:hypothetical protein